MQPVNITSKEKPIEFTIWGDNCQAWTLLKTGTMTIKQETMPPGTEEQLHYHKHAQQYFYILQGQALFEIDEVLHVVHVGQGIQITPDQKHRLMNRQQTDLEFLVCSQPSVETDRFNIA